VSRSFKVLEYFWHNRISRLSASMVRHSAFVAIQFFLLVDAVKRFVFCRVVWLKALSNRLSLTCVFFFCRGLGVFRVRSWINLKIELISETFGKTVESFFIVFPMVLVRDIEMENCENQSCLRKWYPTTRVIYAATFLREPKKVCTTHRMPGC
jgi:hypothetical protein